MGGRRVAVVGVDLSRPAEQRRLGLLSGGDAVERAVRDRGVLIGEPLSRSASLKVGDRVEIEGPEGPVRLPVSGIYRDYTEGGSVTMDLGLMAERLGAGGLTSIALHLRPGADAEAVAAGIESRHPRGSLRVRSNQRLKDDVLHVFDQTFAVTRILQVMSLIIAACAITLTLLVVAQEKASEIALYRTLGAYRRQVFLLFVSKGTAMAFLGLAMGYAAGIALGVIPDLRHSKRATSAGASSGPGPGCPWPAKPSPSCAPRCWRASTRRSGRAGHRRMRLCHADA